MGTIKVGKRILILCEGETEYFYAKSLQSTLSREKQRGLSIETYLHKPNDPESLAKEAKKRVAFAKKERNQFSEVWLFFDNDNWPQLKEAFDIIRKEEFRYAYCSICFEHWYIIHFQDCGRAFLNGDQALSHLKTLWPNYHKTKVKHYENLKDLLHLAKKRAQIIRKNADLELPIYERNPFINIDGLIDFFDELAK